LAASEELQGIFRRSLEELHAIVAWTTAMEQAGKIRPVTVLIGGWAVYAYNPWYASIDIDLITNSEVKNDLMRHLIAVRQFSRDASDPPSTVVKYVKTDGGPGEIRLDFVSRTKSYPFEGINDTLDFRTLEDHTVLKKIGEGLSFRVPERSLLLIYKLKAVSDRSYRIRAQRSNFPEREASKLFKDYCDVLALIDRKQYNDDLDIRIMAEALARYDFLVEILQRLPDKGDAIGWYRRMSPDEVASVCRDLLTLTKK
jgi:hypothetical protein